MNKLVLPLVLALALPLAACGGGDDDEETTVTVYAAASLTAAFEDIADEFEEQHDGVEVELSFAGSSDLATQIQEGAPADVFASADTAPMDELVAADLTDADPEPFATNRLEIAVPPGNPAGITSFQDLAEPGLALVVCAAEVPCGAVARAVAEVAGVTLDPVSEEQSVTDVLGKVTSGEADAGLVYVTDVAAAGDAVEGVTVPESAEVVTTYPIAPVAGTDQPGLAADFTAFVLGDTGRGILAAHGFARP